MKKTYRVEGMSCEHCVASVTKAIEALGAGAKVAVDLPNNAVTVEGLDDDAAVKQAVEQIGFDFKG